MNAPLTIVEATAAMRAGNLTPLELVADCLLRITVHEAQLSAWVHVDQQAALRVAEQQTDALRENRPLGPLHGIPIGVKDIVDVAGLPTRAGATITSDQPAAQDSTVVARLRAAGAIILGKTVTTEFACFDPPPTMNPWNAACTPGGSSSGSAAALAVGMCSGAIGSQTGGSITRPASYCGVAGIKPTFARVSRAGVVPVSEHLDHVGTMARTVTDCGLLLAAIAGADPRDPACSDRVGIELPANLLPQSNGTPPRLGILRPYFFETAEAQTAELTEQAIARLAGEGATIVELPLPDGFDQVHAMHRRIMAREAAVYHRRQYGAPRAVYSPKMAGLIDEGLAIASGDYHEALRHQLAFRDAVDALLADVDAVVVPATPGPAPADLTTTGDPRFNSPWSHAGVPTISFSIDLTPGGLPISLQLVGRSWSEVPLLAAAVWCERAIGFHRLPLLAE